MALRLKNIEMANKLNPKRKIQKQLEQIAETK
jgi:hypothetical protein